MSLDAKAKSKPETSARTTPHTGPSLPEFSVGSAPGRDFRKVLPQDIYRLQRTIGNRAVADLLGRNAPRPAPGGLVVHAAHDRYEQEADQVARQVVGGNHTPPAAITPVAPDVQKSPLSIQRAIDLEEFRTNTNKGTLRRRGDILTAVDTLIKKYKSYPVVVENDTDRNKRMNDLAEIRMIAVKWVERHDVRQLDSVSNDKQGGQQDKSSSRAATLARIVLWLEQSFLPAVDGEINTVTHVRTAEEMNQAAPNYVPQVRPEDAERRKQVKQYGKKQAKQKKGLDKKFAKVSTNTGKFFGTVLPTILRLLAPGPGDLGKFDLQLEFPVADAFGGVQAFVGGRLYLEAESKESNEFKSKFKGAFRTGVKSGIVKAGLETGVQIEAQAQSPEEVSKLFNWGLYRRFRESDYIPRGITNSLWGGSKDTLGYMNAENWAAGVEQDVFNTGKNNEKAYVDLGFYAAGQADVSAGFGKAGGEIFGYRGRKYTQDTIAKARQESFKNIDGSNKTPKELMGKTNYTKKGAQQKIGQGSHRYEIGGKVGIKPWYGDVKLKYESVRSKRKDTGTKDHHNKYRPHKYELEINAGVNLPLGGNLAQRIATSAGPGIAKMIRDTAFLAQTKDAKKAQAGTMLMAGQLDSIAIGFENNIEYNQIAGEGLGSNLANVNPTTGVHSASDAAKGAEMEGGFRLRLKITKEYALDRDKPSAFKIEGTIYSVSTLGGSFVGNKVKLDRATRLAQIKWEKNKKIKFEFLGMAGVAEKKKDQPTDLAATWHAPKYLRPEAPTAPAPRP
jgi:hypothetical protein